ncbi:hypothetical protein PN483_00435 [Nodularia spumigena CS-591/04]|jgi:hypothetical protein|uniref:Uncharacterized protein n=1 Tax=Nodularia spumigena UHCC 0060 TaxID=3110300 RepID=A0ABU5UZF0_NODSP|nr:hypothetical protein [Nodularia spumigena]AHJ29642.1 hypothetical protein NSP_33180 [Nodularia spumigena CCY9414]MDB9328987.1 hypothetical protein [Nodularia spumigena CS-591/04]MDB9359834.1 hypothetical protein [Nodularia spumigena CS-588/02]MDB9364955.1 hypothetical protein [Nodularia spumigena CS-588/02A10]MDB9533422.1 hypothetical protein [Nodularia spumigena CS-1038]MEA5610905.1 hypothetical protein [Nodularia spumigena UHCC 0060]
MIYQFIKIYDGGFKSPTNAYHLSALGYEFSVVVNADIVGGLKPIINLN